VRSAAIGSCSATSPDWTALVSYVLRRMSSQAPWGSRAQGCAPGGALLTGPLVQGA
jgi:hypothetical protein